MEHDIPFGNSNRENGTTFLDFPLFLGIFQLDEPTKRVPFTAEPEIPEILTKWKAPWGSCFIWYLEVTFVTGIKVISKLDSYLIFLFAVIVTTTPRFYNPLCNFNNFSYN